MPGRASLLLVCIFGAACTAPYSPDSRVPIAAAGLSKPQSRNASAVAYQYTTAGGSTVYRCTSGKCGVCIQVSSFCRNLGTGSGDEPNSGVAGLVAVATFNQEVLILNQDCNKTRTLNDRGFLPNDVKFGPGGTIGVTNEYSASYGAGNIYFYPPGSINHNRVAKGLFEYFMFGAFDKNGNFFNDGITPNGQSEIGVVPNGGSTDESAGISGVTRPAGIAIASDGIINIVDQACPCIRRYNGKSHVGDIKLSGIEDPIAVALNKPNNRVWVTDAKAGRLYQYRYPAGGKPVSSIGGLQGNYGVGVLPAPDL
ncbi:MAG TPA: hypothetical protein VFE16_14515 [Candidatus Cybelea sp.]|nr:hypothetical protein [Candidatus Cybelea sp.]